MIILDERQYAYRCLEENDIGSNPYVTLTIIAKYYYHYCGYKKQKIKDLLIDFLNRSYTSYHTEKNTWNKYIETIVSKVNKQILYQISGVKITKSEIVTIQNIHNKLLEKLMFTMLCLAKFYNLKRKNNNSWVNTSAKEIFQLAGISTTIEKRDIKIGELWDLGLIEFSKRNDNLNCRVSFINDDEDEELFVSDFRTLGNEYLLYCGENYIRCAECGLLIKNTVNSHSMYCKNCIANGYPHIKKKVCVDCGINFTVSTLSRRIRCENCYKIERQRIERDKKRKQRCK